jgi:hypothetical protein
MKNGRLLGWPDTGYPRPQGPYYCGVGADDVAGRSVVEAHADACVKAGIMYEGSNAEVLLGQWEFQVGAGDPLTVADHLWLARWLLYRIGEGPHESDRPATEHEADPGFCERRAESAGGVAIDRVETGIRTAEHTKSFHRPSNQGSSALAQSTC